MTGTGRRGAQGRTTGCRPPLRHGVLGLVLVAALTACGVDRTDGADRTSSPTPADASLSPEPPSGGAGTEPPATRDPDAPDDPIGAPEARPEPAQPEPAQPGEDGTGDGPGGPVAVSAVLVSATVNRDAGVVELSGYVAGTVTEGHPCVYELRGGDGSRSVTTTSVADAAVTSCPWGELPLEQLGTGRWEARLSYPSEGVVSAWRPVEGA